MGLFDRSSSSTTNLTENRDNRLALEGGASGISGDGNFMSVSQVSTDHGAIAAGLSVSGGAVTAASDGLKAALSLADSAANRAIASNASTVRDALIAGGEATRDALTANTSISRDALLVSRDALAANTGMARDALTSVIGANRDSLNFASVINRDSIDLAARGQSLIATNAAESLGMVGHVVDLAFRSNDKNTLSALEASVNASNLVSRAYDTATGYQAEKQTADSKYLLYAALAAVAIVAVKGFS